MSNIKLKEEMNGAAPTENLLKKEEKYPAVSYWTVFKFGGKQSLLFFFLGIFFAILHGSLTPLMIIVFANIMSGLIGAMKVPPMASNISISDLDVEGKMLEKFMDRNDDLCLQLVYIGIAAFIFGYMQLMCSTTAGEGIVYNLRREFFQKLLRQDIGWFDKQQCGKLVARNAGDIDSVRDGVSDKICICFQHLTVFFGGFIVAFIYGFKMALLMAVGMPFLAVAGWAVHEFSIKNVKRRQTNYAEAGGIAQQALGSMRTVIAFEGMQKEAQKYDKLLKVSERAEFLNTSMSGVSLGFFFLVMFSTYGAAFYLGPQQVASGNMSVSDVTIVFIGVMIGSMSLGQIVPLITIITQLKASFAFLYYVITNVPDIDIDDESGLKPEKCEGRIEFRNVGFIYPSRPDFKVLKDFSLKVEPGHSIALVGQSGSGKSTTVSLLERFYDVVEGEILIDDVNIKKYNLKWLRDQIGVVAQEPDLFACSIRENVSYGRPNLSDEEIISALKKANAYEFVKELEKGLDTIVGDQGCKMSGGQKQRIAIARAIVKNPTILLLDEATSALDTESERVVQEALDKAKSGRTLLVIAHRLSTIKDSNQIVAMEHGVVKESGSHTELMESKGLYWDLVNMQSLDVQEEETLSKATSIENNVSVSIKDKQSTRVGEEDSLQIEEDLPGFKTLLAVNKPEAVYIFFGCAFAIIASGSLPFFSVFFAGGTEVFVKAPDEMKREAIFWACMFILLGLVCGLSLAIELTMLAVSGSRLTTRLRSKSFLCMLRQDMSYFDKDENSTGALTTRLSQDASLVQGATGVRLKALLECVMGLIVGLIIAFYFGWALALLILAVAPVIMVAGALHAKFATGFQVKNSEDMKSGGKIVNESITNIRTVQSLNLSSRLFTEFASFLVASHKKNFFMAHLFGVAYGLSQGLVFLFYSLCYWFSAYLVKWDMIRPTDSFRVIFALLFAVMSTAQAMIFVPDYGKARVAFKLILRLFGIQPLIDNLSSSGENLDSVDGKIEFENVHFRYPTRMQSPLLRGVNLIVEPGQTLALVGQSGCGKTTIVSLILRFYDPLLGSIKLDGVELKDLNVKSLRRHIALVSQEPILFNTTIAENVRYGALGEVSQDDIEEACKEANVHEFITSLQLGYETNVGDRGSQLSGGQKQRIAIARALVRKPKILLLDEATSALDSESEKVVQEALDKARHGRTCVVIAHRLKTVQTANQIAVVDNGVIAEIGSHDELIAKKALYYRYCQAQAFK